MTDEELSRDPSNEEIIESLTMVGTAGHDMIRRLAWQRDAKDQLIRRAIVGLKHIGTFRYENGMDPHPLDCSLAGRVSHVFGMGMTRSTMLVRHHGEDPAFVNDQEEDIDVTFTEIEDMQLTAAEFSYTRDSNMDQDKRTLREGIMDSDEKLRRALADDWEFVGDPWQLCHVLRTELLSVIKDRDERAVQKGQFFAATETLRDENDAIKNEVCVVLNTLDELAELWGDEGKFRTCRDRLRKMLTGPR